MSSIFFLRTECFLDGGLFVGTAADTKITVEVKEKSFEDRLPQVLVCATVYGPGYTFAAKAYDSEVGHALEQCQANMLNQISKVQNSISLFSIYALAPKSISEAVFEFLLTWRKLPPLIRAGQGSSLVGFAAKGMGKPMTETLQLAMHLPRRHKVENLFRDASEALFYLAVALTAQADEEAETLGIDADIGQALGVDGPSQDMVSDAVPMSETDVLRHVGSAVSDEIGKQIIEDMGKV